MGTENLWPLGLPAGCSYAGLVHKNSIACSLVLLPLTSRESAGVLHPGLGFLTRSQEGINQGCPLVERPLIYIINERKRTICCQFNSITTDGLFSFPLTLKNYLFLFLNHITRAVHAHCRTFQNVENYFKNHIWLYTHHLLLTFW